MPEMNERLATLEQMMKTSLENQSESKERSHKFSNDLMATRSEVAQINQKMDDHAEWKIETNDRVTALEKLKEAVQTSLTVGKWFCTIMGLFFAASLAIGDRVFKLVAWWFT